jgi:uncharacterized protein YihD (DUF1040 family)
MNIEINKIRHPYEVSEGYFDEMEEKVMAQVQIQDLKNHEVSTQYFEDLTSNILSQIKIETLKKAGIPNVGKDYFDNLETEILAKTKFDIFKTKGNTPTPLGYFDKLEEQILAKKNIDILKVANLPATTKGYFEKLEDEILGKTLNQKKVNFLLKKGGLKYFRNAAAVLLISVISVLVYKKTQPKDAFSDISNEEMIAYLADQPLTDLQLATVVDETIALPVNLGVSDLELEQFIKENNI